MEPDKKKMRIELPLEAVDTNEESHEEIYEQEYEENYTLPYDSSDYRFEIPSVAAANDFQDLCDTDRSSAAMVFSNCSKVDDEAHAEEYLRRGPYCEVYDFSNKKELIDLQPFEDIKPYIGFFFVFNNCNTYVENFIYKLLPNDTKAIVVTSSTHHSIIYNENEINNINHMTCALLPQISDANLSMVTVTDTLTKENDYIEYTQMIEKICAQNHEASICFILLCNREGMKEIGPCMAAIAKERLCNNKRSVSLCGGAAKEIHIKNQYINNNLPCGTAIVITGFIQTWSIVLNATYPIEEIIEKLRLFKEQISLQKHSVGFIFVTSEHSNTANPCEYLKTFKEVFPEVLIVGLKCFRVFGIDTITYNKKFVTARSWNLRKFYITFTILTYN